MLDPPSSALPYILEVLSPSFILFDFKSKYSNEFSKSNSDFVFISESVENKLLELVVVLIVLFLI